MSMNSTEKHSENSIKFPLTLKDAIEYLASQSPEYTPNNNNLHNKIWQQLSTRLRLIFNNFTDNQRSLTAIDVNPHDDDIQNIHNCMSHTLSPTRTNTFYKKIRYIYCAVTMHYIGHRRSPLSLNEVPEKWINQNNASELDPVNFANIVEKMSDCIHITHEKDWTDFKIVNLNELSYTYLIELIIDIDKFISEAYDNISKQIPHSVMRNLLSGIKEKVVEEEKEGVEKEKKLKLTKYQIFCGIYYNSEVEKTLSNNFDKYYDFCEALKTLGNTYKSISNHIELANLNLDIIKAPTLPATRDDVSNTETEISQIELDFFSYLLDIIPPRSAKNKNLASQISSGKWEVLSIEARDQILDYITTMSKQPQRIFRFLECDYSENEEENESAYAQIENICLQIRYPYRYKAYNELVSLCYDLKANEKILYYENIENILNRISKIRKTLQRAKEDTV